MVCFPVFWRRKNSRSQIVQHEHDIPIAGNIKIYSFRELRKATRNFCQGNKLGQGSFGCVYLGKLKKGEKVAIKVLSSESRQGTKEFLNELSVISKVWGLYESGNLESIIDGTLQHHFDAEEAHRLLKIGLLCTQDTTKSRPSMSTVAKMLKCECAVSDKIMRPGLITDVMDLKVRALEPAQLSPSMSPTVNDSHVSTLALAGSTVV
ncbi:hypothetical protein PR202_ga11876 [Eleusine coracana subsp. coracana]|uniref:Protein kinase domain-containing protein n=1 Tax=Eleusine coracana subsp. coracana TaxID=191504 RepID=A0AAV5CAF7_ELECO|nr:hypothetical protein PR202_ga11876 [Eleusine coracana subsp. coracana]